MRKDVALTPSTALATLFFLLSCLFQTQYEVYCLFFCILFGLFLAVYSWRFVLFCRGNVAGSVDLGKREDRKEGLNEEEGKETGQDERRIKFLKILNIG